MARNEHQITGTSAGQLSVTDFLLRVALLAGYGREAGPLARRLSEAVRFGSSRSCLEAGAPLQLTVDAPGRAGLRVGLRLGDRLEPGALEGLVTSPGRRSILYDRLADFPYSSHPSLGTWLFWTEERQSIFLDLRDPRPRDALSRLRRILDGRENRRLEEVPFESGEARPWVLRMEADELGVRRLHLHWLLGRHVPGYKAAELLGPGRWPEVCEALGHLLRKPGAGGRWVCVTPLDGRSKPALRVGNTAWTMVPEDHNKHRAVGRLMRAYDGPRDFAEALWSFCRGSAEPGWRVGRACEVTADESGIRVRLFLSPQVQPDRTAGTSRSPKEAGSRSSSDADPSSA